LTSIGYSVPKNFSIQYKAPSARVYGRSKDWITELQKEKAKVPSPNMYEIKTGIAKNPKMPMAKSPRYLLTNYS